MAQIILFNVTNDPKYFPQPTQMFPESRWDEAKNVLADVLKQHGGNVTKWKFRRQLMDTMVGADFPAVHSGYCNGITCIANSGDHPEQRGYFTLYDEEGQTFIYVAQTGDLCLAHFGPESSTAMAYYRIHVCEY